MTQPSLFSYHPDLDYPVIVAEKWDFNLSFIDTPTGRYYHALQWVTGLGAKDKSGWSRIKKQLLNSKQQLKIQVLPFIAADGKTYQVDFITKQSAYIVAQNMRLTKSNPQLGDIQRYLADSGCFVDMARNNPEQAIEILKPLAQIKREKRIALHEQYGLDEKPEALRYKARHELAEEHKALVSTFVAKCDNPNIGRLTDAEYKALLGESTDALKVILKTKSIRDALDTPQLETLRYAEAMLRNILTTWQSATNEQIEMVIYQIMPSIGNTLRVFCEAKGVHHITGRPLLGDGK